jgi:hypothetical protein
MTHGLLPPFDGDVATTIWTVTNLAWMLVDFKRGMSAGDTGSILSMIK